MSAIMKRLTLMSVAIISLSVSACAVTTASLSEGNERSVTRSLNDVSSTRVIKARMKRADHFELKNIDVEVAEGIVLLSGFAPTKEDRLEAERIAWSAPNIREVGNEIMIGQNQSALKDTQDSLLNTRIRSRLIADKEIIARNVNIEVHNGVVYLLGVARTSNELQRIAQTASTTKGAREIVSYMTVHNVNGSDAAQGAMSFADLDGGVPISGLDDLSGQRELPDFLTRAPEGAIPEGAQLLSELPGASEQPVDPTKPFYRDAITGEILDIDPNETIPFEGAEAPKISSSGGYITGNPGDVLEETESAPYYIDPDTGQEIPVVYTVR